MEPQAILSHLVLHRISGINLPQATNPSIAAMDICLYLGIIPGDLQKFPHVLIRDQSLAILPCRFAYPILWHPLLPLIRSMPSLPTTQFALCCKPRDRPQIRTYQEADILPFPEIHIYVTAFAGILDIMNRQGCKTAVLPIFHVMTLTRGFIIYLKSYSLQLLGTCGKTLQH